MTIEARYDGRCKKCGGRINAGDRVEYELGVRGVSHTRCPASPEPAEAREGHGKSWPANGRQRGQSCAACGRGIRDGEVVHYHYLAAGGRQLEHVECPARDEARADKPAEPIALVSGGAQRPAGRNRRAGYCDTCGEHIPAGEGNLVRCYADTGCMKHFDEDGWHLYCLDVEACRARRDEQKKAAAEAAEAAKKKAAADAAAAAERKREYEQRRAELLDGLEQATVDVPAGTERGEVVARSDAGFYRVTLTKASVDGERIVIENATGYDDWRAYVWAAPALARRLRLEEAERLGITREKAEAFLEKYAGCHGADVYRAVVENQ